MLLTLRVWDCGTWWRLMRSSFCLRLEQSSVDDTGLEARVKAPCRFLVYIYVYIYVYVYIKKNYPSAPMYTTMVVKSRYPV